MALPTCQICLEVVDNDVQDNALLDKLCGKNCSAQVCRQCLGQHIDITLQQFYPGVLPRVRCPVCLVDMHVSRWQDRVSDSIQLALESKYAELCQQACIVTPPCCHKTGYSHLPNANSWRDPPIPLKLLPSQLTRFKILCRQFCRHKQPPRAVLDYAFNTFGEEKANILLNELTLPRIVDVERQATLLLSLMYLRPNTKTNCCGANFCFNCKRSGHHESCEEEFDETMNLVRCRSCRVLLLKVDGCNAVSCVCGFLMNWGEELNYRAEYKKKMLPIDIFDVPLFNGWLVFRSRKDQLHRDMQHARLVKLTTAVKPVLYPVFVVFIWRRRFRKVLDRSLGLYCRARRVEQVDQYLATVKCVLSSFLSGSIWWWRFRSALFNTMRAEFYWKAQRRWHPEDLEAADEEANTFFNISAFDEDDD